MNFLDYKDGRDFLNRTHMSAEQALTFLDEEIRKRKKQIEEQEKSKPS